METNFWGNLNILKNFYDSISRNGRVVLLSSMISQRTFYNFKNPKLKNYKTAEYELSQTNVNLTLERLEELAKDFGQDFAKNEHGWPRSAYGVSKLMVNAITRIFG